MEMGNWIWREYIEKKLQFDGYNRLDNDGPNKRKEGKVELWNIWFIESYFVLYNLVI